MRQLSAVAVAVLLLGLVTPLAAAAPVQAARADPAAACWSPWGPITLVEDSAGVMRPAAHRIRVDSLDIGDPRPTLAYTDSGRGLTGSIGIICNNHLYSTIAEWKDALANFGAALAVTVGPQSLRLSLGGRTLALSLDRDRFELDSPTGQTGVTASSTEDLGYPALIAGHHLDGRTAGRTYAIPARVLVLLDPAFHVDPVAAFGGLVVCLNSIPGPPGAAGPGVCLPDPATPAVPVAVGGP